MTEVALCSPYQVYICIKVTDMGRLWVLRLFLAAAVLLGLKPRVTSGQDSSSTTPTTTPSSSPQTTTVSTTPSTTTISTPTTPTTTLTPTTTTTTTNSTRTATRIITTTPAPTVTRHSITTLQTTATSLRAKTTGHTGTKTLPTTSTNTPEENQKNTGSIVAGVLSAIIIITVAILAFVFRQRLLLFYHVCVSRYWIKRQATTADNEMATNRSSQSVVYINMVPPTPEPDRPTSGSDTEAFYAEVGIGENAASENRDHTENKTERCPDEDKTTEVYINGPLGAEVEQNSTPVASGGVNQTTAQGLRQPHEPIYGNLSRGISQGQQPQENTIGAVYEKLQIGGNKSSNYSALTFKSSAD